MKILLINKFLFPKGGAETYVIRLGEELVRQGHEVQYFGMDHPNRTLENHAQSYTSEVDFHNSSKWERLTYPFRILYSAEARKKIRLVLDDFQPDVCHLNNFNYQLTPSMILEIVKWRKETGRKCKIVYTAHDYQLVCPNHMCNVPQTHQNCEKCLESRHYFNCIRQKCIHGSAMRSALGTAEATLWNAWGVYKHIDRIICCSRFLKSKLDTNPLLREKNVAIHNFVEPVVPQTFEKKDYVLYFGRFSIEKGIHTLAEACRNLPDIPFVVAGAGDMEAVLHGLPNVRCVGFQTGDELRKLIAEARFSICPSEWYENCPFSVIESQMYGTPVLGARIGGIPELIDENQTGRFFESGNAEDLAQQIRRMWDDREALEGYSQNSLRKTFLTAAEYVDQLMEIYTQNDENDRSHA